MLFHHNCKATLDKGVLSAKYWKCKCTHWPNICTIRTKCVNYPGSTFMHICPYLSVWFVHRHVFNVLNVPLFFSFTLLEKRIECTRANICTPKGIAIVVHCYSGEVKRNWTNISLSARMMRLFNGLWSADLCRRLTSPYIALIKSEKWQTPSPCWSTRVAGLNPVHSLPHNLSPTLLKITVLL